MKMSISFFAAILIGLSFLYSCSDLDESSPISNANPPKNRRFLALGDSYTIGQSVAVSERWPMQLAEYLRSREVVVDTTAIIAQTGWRTDNLMSAIQSRQPDSSYNLVALLIGVNNLYQGRSVEAYEPEFKALLERSIALAGGRKELVFVVSIPDYGYTPFGESDQAAISAKIDIFNAANKRITAEAGIQYFDITPISRRGLDEPDLVANDGLHPSGKQYRLWVESMQSKVFEMLER